MDSRLRVTDHLLGYEWPVESGSAARGPTSWFAWTLRWRGLDSNLYGAFPVKWFFSVYHQFFVRRCVQGKASMFSRRQSCRGKSQSPVVRIAEEMETEPSKPIDKISRGEITSHRAVSKENALWPRKR